MSQSSWLVAAVIPGVERQPLKKLDADEEALLKLLHPMFARHRRSSDG
jgi:transposase